MRRVYLPYYYDTTNKAWKVYQSVVISKALKAPGKQLSWSIIGVKLVGKPEKPLHNSGSPPDYIYCVNVHPNLIDARNARNIVTFQENSLHGTFVAKKRQGPATEPGAKLTLLHPSVYPRTRTHNERPDNRDRDNDEHNMLSYWRLQLMLVKVKISRIESWTVIVM